jgi:hypothetical protein
MALATKKLAASIDFGGCGVKSVIGLSKGGKLTSSYMEPYAVSVPHSSAASLQVSLKLCDPENCCWVGWNGQYVALGYLARSRFLGKERLAEAKVATAAYKVLGMLWVAAERLQLGSTFDASLSLLLPANEMHSKSALVERIKELAKNFVSPAGEIQANVSTVRCFPEGAGIFYLLAARMPNELRKSDIAIAMLGYRNASILVSRRGTLEVIATSDLGFHALVKEVSKRANNTYPEELVSTVAAGGWAGNKLSFELSAAVSEAQPLYFGALESWLRNSIPKSCNRVVFCGGTADYLKPKLEETFGKSFNPIWHAGESLPPAADNFELGNRLLDAYGVYLIESAGAKESERETLTYRKESKS